MFDLQYIKDFPILGQKRNGYSLVYLDTANTSLTPEPVILAMNHYYRKYNSNIHRALYPIAVEATEAYEFAREKVRNHINALKSEEIIFTRNATDSINLVAQSWGKANLSRGDTVILSLMEHHSNIVPWQILQKEKGFNISFVSVTKDGRIDMESYMDILKKENVKFVSIIHQSNVLGTINPIKEMTRLAHKSGAFFMTDAAQSVPHIEVNCQDLGVDFLAFTGHKCYGPTGIGVLYGREKLLQQMEPVLGGGEMIRTVSLDGSTWNDLPYKFEAGTQNISGAIGLGAALDFLNEIGLDSIQANERILLTNALKKLRSISGLRIQGPLDSCQRGGSISFTLEDIHPHDIASLLGEKNICVRAGHHCAQPLMTHLGIPASTRMSLGLYSQSEDIERLYEGLLDIQKIFS